MYRLRLSLLATTLLFLAPAAAAQTPNSKASDVHVEYLPAEDWTVGDTFGAFLSAEAGLLASGGLGFGAGYLICGGPGWDAVHGGGIGMFAVAPLGSAAAVTLYGSLRGHKGSFWGALGGSYLGAAAGFGLAVLAMETDDHGDGMGLAWAALVTLPALGSSLGYYLSRDTDPRPVSTSGALIDVGRDGVARISVPNITVVPRSDDTVVSVTLLGGAL